VIMISEYNAYLTSYLIRTLQNASIHHSTTIVVKHCATPRLRPARQRYFDTANEHMHHPAGVFLVTHVDLSGTKLQSRHLVTWQISTLYTLDMSGILTRTNNYSQNVVLTEKRWDNYNLWSELARVGTVEVSADVFCIKSRGCNVQT